MNVKNLLLATLQDSGPADLRELREVMLKVCGLRATCTTCILLFVLMSENRVVKIGEQFHAAEEMPRPAA